MGIKELWQRCWDRWLRRSWGCYLWEPDVLLCGLPPRWRKRRRLRWLARQMPAALADYPALRPVWAKLQQKPELLLRLSDWGWAQTWAAVLQGFADQITASPAEDASRDWFFFEPWLQFEKRNGGYPEAAMAHLRQRQAEYAAICQPEQLAALLAELGEHPAQAETFLAPLIAAMLSLLRTRYERDYETEQEVKRIIAASIGMIVIFLVALLLARITNGS